MVPIQQPKARLAAPKYPAQRPELVGTSRGRLGSTGAPGRGSGWEMQEAGLVSLSGVQIKQKVSLPGGCRASASLPQKPEKHKKAKRGRKKGN